MGKYTKEINIYNHKDGTNIFNRGDKYYIPLYQRAYAWTEKQINQLIEDINDHSGENYYIGSLIVYKRASDYEVIDGQQRLTTLLLLFIYLKLEVQDCLKYDCRRKSNETLTRLINGDFSNMNDEDIEASLAIGEKIINEKFKTNNNGHKINVDEFIERLSHVVLYIIEVPQGTDLNRYFEIMNTRGEQLEQPDVVKAKFMDKIASPNDREKFAKVWSACSDMTGYVQMNITDTELRKQLFTDNWVNIQHIDFDKEYQQEHSDTGKKAGNNINEKLQSILYNDPTEKVSTNGNDERTRFESIIDFPHFLLHVLRIFKKVKKIDDYNVGNLLDDTLLLDEYKLLFKSNKAQQLNLPMEFINCLLKCRVLFDKYILKREFAILDNEGKWSLKQINKSEKDSPYYTRSTKNLDNVLMLESAMRVSYTSPKVMHWITRLLIWFYTNEQKEGFDNEFEKVTESFIRESIKADFFSKENYNNMGIETPHIVLNYLDYLLWKENPIKYSDFVFEFRNTVEHWYPQHPSAGGFDIWGKEVDNFGNLCLLQRSYNSRFSNLEPHSKKNSFSGMIAKGSIKLRLMAELTIEGTKWKDVYQSFGEQMIQKLRDTVGVNTSI